MSERLRLPRRHWSARLVDRLFGAAEALGRRPFALDADRALDRARRRTGLEDFGPDWSRDGLDALVAALRGPHDPGPFGRLLLGALVDELLEFQLRVVADRRRDPRIAAVPIEPPIIIAGLFRTGTTLLQRMLARHPQLDGLPLAHLRYPSPPPGEDPRADARRMALMRRRLQQVDALNPAVRAQHWTSAEEPDEELWTGLRQFRSIVFEFTVDVPAYGDWLRTADRAPLYRALRGELQALRLNRPRRLVLKMPGHLWSLGALRAAFPDAWIIRTHRRLDRALPSLCGLAVATRRLFMPQIDLEATGRYFLDRVADGLTDSLAAMPPGADPRCIELPFETFVADPSAAVADLCGRIGLDHDPQIAAAIAEELAVRAARTADRDRPRYTLETFGLEKAAVERRCADYIDAFLQGDRPAG